jgi:glycosyltransferase involved in cell wall biosynthesis
LVEVERAEPSKVDVLYNGVDIAKFTRRGPAGATPLRKLTGGKVVGIVANYRAVKDLELFLRAAKAVVAEVPETRFALIGQGSLGPSLKSLAAELGIQDRVFFSDGIGAVPDYLSQFDVGCLSSSSEGFSNSILEYMAAGLPTVATDVGGNREAIDDGVTGYVVANRESEALAAPIIRLLKDDQLRTTMGQAALQRCRERFDMNSATLQLEAYYLNVLGNTKD